MSERATPRKRVRMDWANVDRSESPDPYVDYLDTATGVTSYKQLSHQALGLRPGDKVLDVGCGTGDDVIALANFVAPNGRAVGVDLSAKLIDAARMRASDTGLPITFHVGDVYDLPFPDNSFDACRIERTLQHLERPQDALQEMIRVAKPSGSIQVVEPDWETMAVDVPDRHLFRKLLHFKVDLQINGWMGRQIYRLMRQAGLEDVEPLKGGQPFFSTDLELSDKVLGLFSLADYALEAGVITSQERDVWIDALNDAAGRETFYASLNGAGVMGRKTA